MDGWHFAIWYCFILFRTKYMLSWLGLKEFLKKDMIVKVMMKFWSVSTLREQKEEEEKQSKTQALAK